MFSDVPSDCLKLICSCFVLEEVSSIRYYTNIVWHVATCWVYSVNCWRVPVFSKINSPFANDWLNRYTKGWTGFGYNNIFNFKIKKHIALIHPSAYSIPKFFFWRKLNVSLNIAFFTSRISTLVQNVFSSVLAATCVKIKNSQRFLAFCTLHEQWTASSVRPTSKFLFHAETTKVLGLIVYHKNKKADFFTPSQRDERRGLLFKRK